jgi:hypothetical protein
MLVRAALLVLLASGAARALTPGGGSPATDCQAEFGGTPANAPLASPRFIRCTDNDPCDDNPEVGMCSIRLEICLNVTDPLLPGCAPTALDSYTVANAQPDTDPHHDFDFQTLEDRLNFLTLPVTAADLDVCSGDVLMNVRLPIWLRVGGATYLKGRKLLRASVTGPTGTGDKDRLRIFCEPRDGTAPCDGVTSTFDQIERHIFTPTCARSTCHNVAQGLHSLSLSAGEAYANLVGVPPVNFAAAAAGKLRVDPGNVANSFIVQKLRGQLVTGEGERMPLGLRAQRDMNIQLIEQWIAAGAPATGFVAPVGCH